MDRLKGYAEEQQYESAGQLMQATNQLLTHFEEYKTVPKIAEIRETLAHITGLFRTLCWPTDCDPHANLPNDYILVAYPVDTKCMV